MAVDAAFFTIFTISLAERPILRNVGPQTAARRMLNPSQYPFDMLYTVDDIPDLRRNVWLCRQFRQEAARRGNWKDEVFAETQIRSARRRYRNAVQWLRCSY